MKYILILFLSLVFLGCKKFKNEPESNRAILGTWKFISSAGGFSNFGDGTFNTKFTVEFRNSGNYIEFEGKYKQRSEKFKFERAISLFTSNEEAVIFYEKKIAQTFRVSNDTLYLFDQRAEGYTYVFVKN